MGRAVSRFAPGQLQNASLGLRSPTAVLGSTVTRIQAAQSLLLEKFLPKVNAFFLQNSLHTGWLPSPVERIGLGPVKTQGQAEAPFLGLDPTVVSLGAVRPTNSSAKRRGGERRYAA